MRKRLPEFRLNVYYRIIGPFLAIIILGILSTIPFGIRLTTRLNIEKADQEMSSVSDVVANYIHVRLDELLAITQSTIQNGLVQRAISGKDPDTLISFLLPLKIRLRIGLVAAYDKSRKRIVGLGETELLKEIDTMSTIPKALMGINIKSLETTRDDMLLLAAVPNEVAGREMDGALVAGFVVNDGFMGELAKLMGHPLALISEDGRLIKASDPLMIDPLRAKSALETEGKPLFLDFTMREEPYRAVVKQLALYEQPKARIVIAAPMKEIIAIRNHIMALIILMGLISTILVMILGMILARSINNPIRRLLALTREVGEGNLDVRIDKISRDELGDLTKSFNTMVAGLKSSMAEIQTSRTKIANYAHELESFSLQLERDKKEIEAILQNMRDGLIMIDRKRTISAINPEALRIIGHDQEHVFGKDVLEAFKPFMERLSDKAPFLKIIDFMGTDTAQEENREVSVEDPYRVIFRIKRYPVFDEENVLLGWILIWTNITREKEVEEMKNNFLATISHELRTPLTSIKGSLNLLMDGNLGPISQDQREFIKIANQNSERLTALVNNILDLARIEAGEFKSRRIDCNLAILVKKALSDIKAVALNRQIKLTFSTVVRLARIQADPERITQLVSNIVDNAIKYGPNESKIIVRLEQLQLPTDDSELPDLTNLKAGSYYAVHISDQGIGIPDDQIDKIFEKFHQVDMSSTRQKGGSGLGLAISKTIIEEHGGAIWVKSLPKGGSRFSFVIPCAQLAQKIDMPKP